MESSNRGSLVQKLLVQKNTQTLLQSILFFCGFAIYLYNSFQAALTKLSFLDEGLYLNKGFQAVTGKYPLFEDFGLWTNHMPLSFLFPGAFQALFGPGLRTGRYFAIFISVIFLFGLYLCIRRFSGPWFAVLSIWVFALNPAVDKVYSMALTEGMVAALLVWMIYLGVLPDRKNWQIVTAGFLSGLILMVRENMIVVFPLFVLYELWQYGWKRASITLLAGLAPILVINAIYWPNILQVWAMWIPKAISPFLDPWRLTSDGIFLLSQIPDKASDLTERLVNAGLLLRNHFVSFFAFGSICVLFPPLSKIELSKHFKAIVFLFVLYVSLLGMHLYASFGMDYCVSCILLYIEYFEFIPIILVAILYFKLEEDISCSRKRVFWFLTGLVLLGILISSIDDLMQTFVFKNSSLLGQLVDFGNPLVAWLQQQFHLRYYPAVRIELAVFLVILVALVAAIGVFLYKTHLVKPMVISIKLSILCILIIGVMLSPTVLLGKANDFFACSGNVLDAYEKAGIKLNELIPSGEKVYWEGRSNAILLYLKDISIYPPQLNNSHNYYKGGDSNALLRMGRYNDLLASEWLESSKYILLEEQYTKKWELEALAADGITTPVVTVGLGQCEAAGQVDLFIRK